MHGHIWCMYTTNILNMSTVSHYVSDASRHVVSVLKLIHVHLMCDIFQFKWWVG